ncbi:MAG TPA: hypothetical protein IGS53_11475 [Leptolyngbyaceae cyanobacterium M33_DOE_097]|nr:hypothetical protein [Leptolyngbyaceae cyanobacterium M33_DOE_097]
MNSSPSMMCVTIPQKWKSAEPTIAFLPFKSGDHTNQEKATSARAIAKTF